MGKGCFGWWVAMAILIEKLKARSKGVWTLDDDFYFFIFLFLILYFFFKKKGPRYNVSLCLWTTIDALSGCRASTSHPVHRFSVPVPMLVCHVSPTERQTHTCTVPTPPRTSLYHPDGLPRYHWSE